MHKNPVQGCTKIVYIEADRANALLMQDLLRSKTDYCLHLAKDGLSGLELCKRVKPDLVITEMHLPDVTAYEVLRALRDHPATDGLPCIVFSGDAMPGHIARALAAGFDDYWTKPIDIWQLLRNINEAAASKWSRARQQKNASSIKARMGAREIFAIEH